jgi:hypothetical protein
MDLANLKPTSDTVDVILKHPSTFEELTNEDGSAMVITVYAPHSKEYKSLVHEQTNRRLKQAQSKKKMEITAEDLEASGLEMLAKSTVSWAITYDGKKA